MVAAECVSQYCTQISGVKAENWDIYAAQRRNVRTHFIITVDGLGNDWRGDQIDVADDGDNYDFRDL